MFPSLNKDPFSNPLKASASASEFYDTRAGTKMARPVAECFEQRLTYMGHR